MCQGRRVRVRVRVRACLVRVGAIVGHREPSRLGMLEAEVLIGKGATLQRVAARAVAAREVSALQHEARHDAVQPAPLEV